jgi:hypothetical protein
MSTQRKKSFKSRHERLSRADKAKHGDGSARYKHRLLVNQIYDILDDFTDANPNTFTQEERDKLTLYINDIQFFTELPSLVTGLKEGKIAELKEFMAKRPQPPSTIDVKSLDKSLTEAASPVPPVVPTAPATVTPTIAAPQIEDIAAEDEKKVKEFISRMCPGLDGYVCPGSRTKVAGLELCSPCNRKQDQKPIKELAKEINNNRRVQVRMEAARIKKIALQALKRDMQKALEQSQKGLEGSTSDDEMSDS